MPVYGYCAAVVEFDGVARSRGRWWLLVLRGGQIRSGIIPEGVHAARTILGPLAGADTTVARCQGECRKHIAFSMLIVLIELFN